MLHRAWKTIVRDNGKIEIYGNGHIRDLINYWELMPKEIRQFDWIDDPDYGYTFFRYKGWTYCTADFPRIEKYAPEWMQEFDGYSGDSFFSGVLVKYAEIEDSYGDMGLKVYTYIAS